MSVPRRRRQEFADMQPWVRYAEHEFWRSPMAMRRIFDHEFIYVLKGWVRAEFEGKKVLMQPGDLWIIEPGVPHAGVPEPTVTEIFGVHFDYVTRRDSARLHYPIRDERKMPPLRQRVAFPNANILAGVYHADELPDLRAPFTALVEAFHDRRPADLLRVRARWFDLFYMLVRAVASGGRSGGSLIRHREEVARAQAWIEAHYTSPLDREALAERVGLSPTHLTHLFKRLTGRSPLEHQQHLRMTEAKRLLREGKLKMREVARLVGFEDPYHFSRAFKRHEGHSPRAYLDMLRRGG